MSDQTNIYRTGENWALITDTDSTLALQRGGPALGAPGNFLDPLMRGPGRGVQDHLPPLPSRGIRQITIGRKQRIAVHDGYFGGQGVEDVGSAGAVSGV